MISYKIFPITDIKNKGNHLTKKIDQGPQYHMIQIHKPEKL